MRVKYLLTSGALGVTAVVSLLLLWPDSSTSASNTTEGLTANTSSGQMSLDSSNPTLSSIPGKVAPEVTNALSSASSVSVIVSLTGGPAPWAVTPPVDVVALADSVAASAVRVLASVPPNEFKLAQQYQAVPALAGDATAAGVAALAAHPDVVHVGLNREVRADLAQAVPLIGADDVHNILGKTGAGVVVAVLDTGIDTDHPLLLDDLNHQKCFLDSGTCPGGGTTGPSAEDGNGHGSHVSGIVTSSGPPVGVAPDALIDAFKVLDDSGSGSISNVLAAYDEIILNHPEVDVINMSLSDGGSYPAGACETRTPALTTAIGTTRAMGMTTFAAAGNNGSKSGIAYPACINDIVSVGAVYDANVGLQNWSSCADLTTAADQVVCFSQSNISLDLLAPGSRIDSTVDGGGLANKSGTSMASPAAAAAAALLLESEPLLTPSGVETRLKETGAPVTDASNSVTTCRVDVYEAVINDGGSICVSAGPPPPPPPPNGDFANAYVVPEALPYTNSQATLSATTEVGEPSPCGGIASTVWYSFTPSASQIIMVDTFDSDYDTVLAVHTGPSVGSLTLVGCNDDSDGQQSQVQFSAIGGTTYHIQVGGFFGSMGDLVFTVAVAPPTPTPVLAEMALDVTSGGACAGGVCQVEPGSTFTLAVDVVTRPAAGYISVQTYIDFGVYNPTASEDGAGPDSCSDSIDNGGGDGADRFDADCVTVDLVYKPAVQVTDEIIWPDLDSEWEFRDEPGPGLLVHAGLTGIAPPSPVSTFEGNIIAIQMTCPSSPTQATISLLPYGDPIAQLFGSRFTEPGPTNVVPNVGSLTINCIVPPTPTPTVTPTPTPTATPTPTKQPDPGDTDGDGCPDVRENGLDETLGGLRDYKNPWDFYDVAGLSGATPDGYIDLLFDILGVIQHYSPQGAPPYDVAFDRGPSIGPNPWNMTAPDGSIDLLNDILGVIQQFSHDCW